MTSNSAWVTTIRSQPASRAASMIARASAAAECPVSTTSFCAAHSFNTSRTAGSTLPSSPTTLMPDGASLSRVTWLFASNVGNHTTRAEPALHAPHPPDGVDVDAAGGAVERDAAEHLHARDTPAR